MGQDPLLIIAMIACGVVALILITGVVTFGRGGEVNKRHGNRLMRWRIIGQAIAIALILLFIWLRQNGGA